MNSGSRNVRYQSSIPVAFGIAVPVPARSLRGSAGSGERLAQAGERRQQLGTIGIGDGSPTSPGTAVAAAPVDTGSLRVRLLTNDELAQIIRKRQEAEAGDGSYEHDEPSSPGW